MNEFAIKSKRIVTPEGIINGCVLVRDGVIIDILKEMPEGFSMEVTDAGNKVLMPGVTDPHVHINEPGRTEWEGFETATRAAVAGGITMLVDMPLNSSPVTTSAGAFDQKCAAATNKIRTNVGFWGGVVPGNEPEIEPLIAKGVLGFKAFLTHSGIDEFPNVTKDDLQKVMPILARHHLPLLVHCELTTDHRPQTTDQTSELFQPSVVRRLTTDQVPSSVVRHPSSSYQRYLASRPKEWEDDAIAMMIQLCEEFNCRVHIVHLSSANSIAQIAAGKAKGLPLTVETAQHYLYFNAEEIADGDTAFKCAPPIREKANNELLWQALKEGIIDFVATDHSPAPPDLKELESGDFTKAWGGISSLQFALPILWTSARERGCTLNDLAKWLCENPARLAGVEKSKGKIAIGYDADFIVLDDEQSFTVTKQMIQHKHKVTPYVNQTLSGVVEQTFLAGTKVFDRGTFAEVNNAQIITRNR